MTVLIQRLTVPVLAALTVWIGPAAPAAAAVCPPSPWGCPNFGAESYRGSTTVGEHVTVIGDSLIQNLDAMVADQLSSNGFVSFTIGAGGYAYWHWNNGVAEGLDIGDYAVRERADHVVLALGTNDARVLGAVPPRVTQQDVADQVLWGMTRADDSSSGCVILISPTTRGYPDSARAVRDVIAWLVAVRNNALGSTHFVVADWGAHADGHPEWFIRPGDVHLSPEGNRQYAAFITWHAALARNGAFGC